MQRLRRMPKEKFAKKPTISQNAKKAKNAKKTKMQ